LITDFFTTDSDIALEADVCIVGSGPAGLTIASDFADSQHEVVVLEAGGFDYDPNSQEIYAGTVTGRDYPVATSRLRVFGGTSGHWTGQCAPIPQRHFSSRPGMPEVSWPITFDEIRKYYRKANQLLQLGHFDYDEAEAKSLARGASPSAEGPMSPILWRHRSEGPFRFGPLMREEMERADNIKVFLHANATKLSTNSNGTQLASIRFSTLDGKEGIVSAKYFVLACGGLETPRLLLNANDVQRAGIGNDRDMVGRYFMEHPNATIGTLKISDSLVPESLWLLTKWVTDQRPPVGSWLPAYSLSEQAELQQMSGGGYYKFRIQYPWRDALSNFQTRRTTPFNRIGMLAQHFDEWAYFAYRRLVGDSATPWLSTHGGARIFVEFEQAPNRDSRVFITNDRDRLGLRRLGLDWRLDQKDIRTARVLGTALGREAQLKGWGRFRFDDWLMDRGAEGSDKFGFSSHHIGTARMGAGPADAVVDSRCRVFACDNLYIGGSAVFPTGSFVNPTLTIVALAYRIADDLKSELG